MTFLISQKWCIIIICILLCAGCQCRRGSELAAYVYEGDDGFSILLDATMKTKGLKGQEILLLLIESDRKLVLDKRYSAVDVKVYGYYDSDQSIDPVNFTSWSEARIEERMGSYDEGFIQIRQDAVILHLLDGEVEDILNGVYNINGKPVR